MSELADGSRQLKASLIAAVTGRTQDYERALAVVLWLHARRADPQARLSPFMALTFTELTDQLGALAPAGEPDPTTPAPA